MKKIAVLAAALALCSSSALAQVTPAPPAAVTRERPSPEAMQAAREMIEALQLDRQLELITQNTVGPIVDAQMRRYRNVTAEQREALVAATMDGMRAIMPRYRERIVEIYAEAFTIQEMNAIRDFYRTPAGRASLERIPQLSVEATNAMTPLLPVLEREIRDSLCRRLDCGDLQPTAVS